MIRAVAIAASLAAEALAVYTLAEAMAGGYEAGHRHAMGAWAFILIGMVAFVLPLGVQVVGLSRRGAYVATGITAFVVLYGILRIEFAGDFALWNFSWAGDFVRDADETLRRGSPATMAAILGVALWVRSAIRSADDIDLELIPRSVGIPFAAVTLILVVAAASDRSAEVARGGAAFYAVAVVALACSQLSLSGATIGDLRAGGVTAVLLGGTIAVTLACVAVFGVLFAVLGPIVGPILGDIVETVLTIILTPPAWLLSKLFRAILGNTNPFEGLKPITMSGARQAGEGEADGSSPWSQAAVYALRALALVAVLAAVAGIVLFFARVRRRVSEARQEAAAAGSAGGLGEDARAVLRALFRRRHADGPGGEGAIRLYREVLDQAERAGYPRQPGETPEEYAPTLETAFHAPVTDEITAAFEQARYAGREPDARTLADLEQRWRSLA